MKKVLIISTIPTHPTDQGNKKCMLTYSKLISELGYHTTFLLIIDSFTTQQDVEETSAYWGKDIIIFKRSRFDKFKLIWNNRIYAKFSNNYCSLDFMYPFGFSHFLKTIQDKYNFQTVIVNYIFLTKAFQSFSKNTIKLLYTHDSFTERAKRTGHIGLSVKKEDEAKALNRSDVILSIQEEESLFFKKLTNRKVITCFTPFPLKETKSINGDFLLFVASGNPHNVQGIRDFVEFTLERITAKSPNTTLLIGGSICSKISDFQNKNNLKLYGYIDDLDDFYNQGKIVINPVSTGTGFKIKSFEALSYGKILVSHPHNTIGMFDKLNSPIIEAETPDEYADAIANLLNDEVSMQKRAEESISYIKQFNQHVSNCFFEAIENNTYSK